jgi:hypothetical protein
VNKILLGNRAREKVGIVFCKVHNNSTLISWLAEIWPPSESIEVTAGNGT